MDKIAAADTPHRTGDSIAKLDIDKGDIEIRRGFDERLDGASRRCIRGIEAERQPAAFNSLYQIPVFDLAARTSVVNHPAHRFCGVVRDLDRERDGNQAVQVEDGRRPISQLLDSATLGFQNHVTHHAFKGQRIVGKAGLVE